MSKLDCPFLIKLYYAFQSVNNLNSLYYIAKIPPFADGFLSRWLIILQYDKKAKVQLIGGQVYLLWSFFRGLISSQS